MARSLRINHGLKSLRVQFCHCQTLQIAPILLTEGKRPIFRSETSKQCRQVPAKVADSIEFERACKEVSIEDERPFRFISFPFDLQDRGRNLGRAIALSFSNVER
jgi:hypothetical protein